MNRGPREPTLGGLGHWPKPKSILSDVKSILPVDTLDGRQDVISGKGSTSVGRLQPPRESPRDHLQDMARDAEASA
jgi:hypothetical protein